MIDFFLQNRETAFMTRTKAEIYDTLYGEARAILEGTEDLISAMATLVCQLKRDFPDLIVAAFYRQVGENLHVGPYQGTLSCTFIPEGRGVCGTAAAQKKTLIVPDVHKFDGHIVCDSKANSEIVVPVFDQQKNLVAVLDMDSAEFNHFDETDQEKLEALVSLLTDKMILV